MLPLRLLAFLALCLITQAAQALVVYESGTSLDNSYNTAAPMDGAPWDYVAQVGVNNASAVYLGNGWCATAAHVLMDSSTPIRLNGATYYEDPSVQTRGIGNVDVMLFKILGDPGLSMLPLALPSDNDLNQSAIRIGCGVGKGSVIALGQSQDAGFTWDYGTYAKRWGIGETLGNTFIGTDGDQTVYLATPFDPSLGPDAASASMGDSGGGVFEQLDGVWKLAGITCGVDTLGASYYSPPDNSYDLEVSHYSAWINGIVVPEPDAGVLLGLGGITMLLRKRSPLTVVLQRGRIGRPASIESRATRDDRVLQCLPPSRSV